MLASVWYSMQYVCIACEWSEEEIVALGDKINKNIGSVNMHGMYSHIGIRIHTYICTYVTYCPLIHPHNIPVREVQCRG